MPELESRTCLFIEKGQTTQCMNSKSDARKQSKFMGQNSTGMALPSMSLSLLPFLIFHSQLLSWTQLYADPTSSCFSNKKKTSQMFLIGRHLKQHKPAKVI